MRNETLFKLGQKIRYECGKHDVKFTTLEKIANALGIEISDIVQFKF